MKYRLNKQSIFVWAVSIAIVVALVFAIKTYSRSGRLIGLFNYAGKNGLPVAMVSWGKGKFSFNTPGRNPVFIKIDKLKDHAYFCFSASGDLHCVKADWPVENVFEIPFPYLYSREIKKFDRYIGPWDQPFEDQAWFWPQFGNITDKGYEIKDLVSLKKVEGSWKEPFPFGDPGWPYISVSPDLSVFYYLVWGFPPSEKKNELWRYVIGNGVWSKVIDDIKGEVSAVGYQGEYVVVPEIHDDGSMDWKVVDGVNGDELRTIKNGTSDNPVRIGGDWISHFRYYNDPNDGYVNEIIFVSLNDMNKEYTIKFPVPPEMYNFIMFEPPPGGVKQMLEMRKAEKKNVDDW